MATKRKGWFKRFWNNIQDPIKSAFQTLIEAAEHTIQPKIEGINNPTAKILAEIAIEVGTTYAEIKTDENPDDKAQVLSMLEDKAEAILTKAVIPFGHAQIERIRELAQKKGWSKIQEEVMVALAVEAHEALVKEAIEQVDLIDKSDNQ